MTEHIPGGYVIYVPKGQAGEYAELASNPYKGCGHACKYCYVPLITKQDRGAFDAGAVPREDYLQRLRRDGRRLQERESA
jgi:DNA repair photolyase